MLNHFRGYISYTEDEFKEIWRKSIVVIDTNILLYFYKYTSKQSSQSLLGILRRLKEENRLWIPYQVALEYFFNYENNMFKQQEGYRKLEQKLIGLKEDARKTLATVKSDYPYIDTEDFNYFVENMEIANNELKSHIQKEIDELPDSKKIHIDILDLLNSIVGNPYTQDEIDEIEAQGEKRYSDEVPPGFSDKLEKNKTESRTYLDVKYQQKYGDLIVWNQIIDKVKKDGNLNPVIWITEDRTIDWWDKEEQKIKRPHPHLIQEFHNKTKQKFYMYRIESFVENAIKYLNVEVTPEQLDEFSTEVENIREAEKKNESKKQQLLTERNYRNILRKSNVKLVEILDYLPQTKKREATNRISEILHGKEPKENDYNSTVSWLSDNSIPELERKAKDLVTEIAIKYNEEETEMYLNRFNSTSTDPVERVVTLLELIKNMKNFINNDGLPF